MGYPMDAFLVQEDKIDNEFICSICQEVMKDPIMIEACQHIFCTMCLHTWMAETSTCPVDRSAINDSKLVAPFRAYMNMYNRIPLRCGIDGCLVVSNLGEIQIHTKNCAFNPEAIKPCVHNCGASIQMKHIPNHNCIEYLKAQVQKKDKEVFKLKIQFQAMQTRMDSEIAKCMQALFVKDKEIDELKMAGRQNLLSVSDVSVFSNPFQGTQQFYIHVQEELKLDTLYSLC